MQTNAKWRNGKRSLCGQGLALNVCEVTCLVAEPRRPAAGPGLGEAPALLWGRGSGLAREPRPAGEREDWHRLGASVLAGTGGP